MCKQEEKKGNRGKGGATVLDGLGKKAKRHGKETQGINSH